MRLTFMWKDPGSHGGACPALYEAEDGYVVQGVKLDAATRAQLRDLAVDEDAVFVPAPVLDRLRVTQCAPMEPDASLQNLCKAIELAPVVIDQTTPEETEK